MPRDDGLLSKRNACGSLQGALDQDVEGAGKGFAFELDHGWFFLHQAGWKCGPGRSCRWERLRGGAENQGVGAVERGAGRVLEVFFGGVEHRDVEARFQELEQGIAFHDERRLIRFRIAQSFVQRSSEERKTFRKKALLGSEPKRSLGAGCEKPSAVCAGARLRFPVNGADMLRRGAIAIVAILSADAVAVLRNFSGDPMGVRERGDHVAHELRLTNAAGVPADDDYAPGWRTVFATWRQVSPLAL